MPRTIRLSLGFALIAARVALAADPTPDSMSLVKSAKSPSRAYINAAIDTLGVRLGMTLGEVKNAIKGFGGKPHVDEMSLVAQYRDVSVSSQNFPKSLIAARFDKNAGISETVTVSFSTPAIGSTVMSIDRTFLFINSLTAPKVEDVVKQLRSKYGQMSVSKMMEWNPTSRNGYWVYDEKALMTCINNFCPFTVSGTNKLGVTLAKKAIEKNAHLQIEVFIAIDTHDLDRVSSMHITLVDNDAIVLSHDEAAKQIEVAAIANYKRRSTPQAAPKL